MILVFWTLNQIQYVKKGQYHTRLIAYKYGDEIKSTSTPFIGNDDSSVKDDDSSIIAT